MSCHAISRGKQFARRNLGCNVIGDYGVGDGVGLVLSVVVVVVFFFVVRW